MFPRQRPQAGHQLGGAAAILGGLVRTRAWREKRVAGTLLMDVKSAFNNVNKSLLGRRMETLEIEPDLIRWTHSFMSERQVQLVLDGRTGEASQVDTGIPQGSPVAPTLFVTYLSGIFDKVEAAVPGVRGLSFVDDVSWWADGKDGEEVATKLSEAAAAATEWAARSAVAFDPGKTEAALFHRKRSLPETTVAVGDCDIPFNKEATRWLGIWLDSQLTLKEHHAVRMKKGRQAMARLHRLTGQMGLSPTNCRKVMTACVQPVAMYGAELWWKGDLAEGTIGRAKELQILVNQEARATTGCFRTTNLGALSMESGLRSAPAQLENRQPRFGLRLLSLPEGDQAREVVGAPTEIGRRLKNSLAYGGQMEKTVLLEEPETFDAELLQEEEAEAKAEAKRTRPGLTMFTDGSRLDNRATGFAVVWKRGLTWAGVKGHMGSNQEAYDAECAALARALEEALRRNTTPERITIFTDATAAIRRMASDEPDPGQQYALQARKHIATLRRARPGIVIEIRWCPAHKGVAGNEKADEWAKAAAEQSGIHRPIPQSLTNLKREISEKKWVEARQWAGARTSKKKYRLPERQRPDGAVAGSTKRLASRFYQLKTGHCLTGRWKERWKVRDLLADGRCSRAVLDFLSSTDVGRRVPAEDEVVSEVSEAEVREFLEEQGAGADGAGAGGTPLFLPRPGFMASEKKKKIVISEAAAHV